jgi:hypothetical protein
MIFFLVSIIRDCGKANNMLLIIANTLKFFTFHHMKIIYSGMTIFPVHKNLRALKQSEEPNVYC